MKHQASKSPVYVFETLCRRMFKFANYTTDKTKKNTWETCDFQHTAAVSKIWV